jgi:pimeloyl-ACP methyl ester carboxylesterase
MFVPPETEYAAVGAERIAYQVLGDGPRDLVWLGPWWSHIDGRWEDLRFRDFLRRLARFSRLITFDKRGSGGSDLWVPKMSSGCRDRDFPETAPSDETGRSTKGLIRLVG